MSQSSWLVAGIVPGVERQPLKKIDEGALLNVLKRWRAEAEKKGHRITRMAVAFEAGHDGFWLARCAGLPSTDERKRGTHFSLAADPSHSVRKAAKPWSQNFRWPVLGRNANGAADRKTRSFRR